MAQNFRRWFITLKIVDFKADNNILWNTQNASDCIIFKKNSGEHAFRPP